jgi:dihydrofolate synthase/folylpolyglutamate synthase
VGLYTSPHLIRFNERIRVNNNPIENAQIVRFIEQYKSDIDEIKSTFFETTTALAFKHFSNQNIDIAIIETGLGGRLDSTNVLKPNVTVITPVSLDHCDILGNDILSIAGEKEGIIKKNIPLVLAPQLLAVQNQLLKKAEKVGASVINVEIPSKVQITEWGTKFKRKDQLFNIPLVGFHQAINASVGIELTQSFMPEIKKEIIDTGLTKVKWPGRLQRMKKEYPIYYDVAHNFHGVQSILETMSQIFKKKPFGLFVMKKNKEPDLVVQALENKFDQLILSGAPELGLMSGYELSQKLSNFGLKDFVVIDRFQSALDHMVEITQKTGRPTLVLGSHYIARLVFNKFGFLF